MSIALRLDGLTKSFGLMRRKFALDGLSFEVPTGSISGMVGPNGAGKTTAFSVVCGYLQPNAGRVDILGSGSFDPMRLKGRLGVLPQDAELGLRHTPLEYLEHLARLQGMSRHDARTDSARLLDRLHLADRSGDRIGSLSHGMRRRVAVATALLGDPELVLLDEPMSGLDPREVVSLRDFLAEQSGRRTLVLSSHNLAELELLCDHLLVLDHGRCLYQGTISEFTAKDQSAQWLLGVGFLDIEALRLLMPGHQLELDDRVLLHSASSEQALDEGSVIIAGYLASLNIAIHELRRGKSLERGYMERSANKPVAANQDSMRL